MYLADMAMASVSVGMMALRSVVPLEMTGRSFNLIARSCIKSRATKKLGREFPTKLRKRRM